MKQHIFPALRLTLVCILFYLRYLHFTYLGNCTGSTKQGKGETVIINNKVVGYKLEGQNFTDDKYFGADLPLWL